MKLIYRLLGALLVWGWAAQGAWGQDAADAEPAAVEATDAGTEAAGQADTEAAEGQGLPQSFRGISLGMGLEELKTALADDALFDFRGDRDVSWLPVREEALVETTGRSFIKRAFFQLREGKLFIMSFSLDLASMDHYSVFTTLVKKYGEPQKLSPREAVWESEALRLALERPLTLKYIDMATFKQIQDESSVQEADVVNRRQEFLDAL